MSASPSDGTYEGTTNYNRFNYYYTTITPTPDRLKKVKKTKSPIKPEKEKVHIFDIKDLDLKEVL